MVPIILAPIALTIRRNQNDFRECIILTEIATHFL